MLGDRTGTNTTSPSSSVGSTFGSLFFCSSERLAFALGGVPRMGTHPNPSK